MSKQLPPSRSAEYARKASAKRRERLYHMPAVFTLEQKAKLTILAEKCRTSRTGFLRAAVEAAYEQLCGPAHDRPTEN